MQEQPLKQAWEADNTHELLVMLIGYSVGLFPERHIEAIRSWRRRIVEFLDKSFLQLRKSDIVLEIGSGCGFTSQALAERCRWLHCVDISTSFLQFARRECADSLNINFHCGSYTDLSFLEDDSVDCVVASAVLIHGDIFSINLFLAEVTRILRPGGRVVFDFLDANRLTAHDPLLAQHTAEYQANPSRYPGLCKWHSGKLLTAIACGKGLTTWLRVLGRGPNTILYAEAHKNLLSPFKLRARYRWMKFYTTHPISFLDPPSVPEDEKARTSFKAGARDPKQH